LSLPGSTRISNAICGGHERSHSIDGNAGHSGKNSSARSHGSSNVSSECEPALLHLADRSRPDVDLLAGHSAIGRLPSVAVFQLLEIVQVLLAGEQRSVAGV